MPSPFGRGDGNGAGEPSGPGENARSYATAHLRLSDDGTAANDVPACTDIRHVFPLSAQHYEMHAFVRSRRWRQRRGARRGGWGGGGTVRRVCHTNAEQTDSLERCRGWNGRRGLHGVVLRSERSDAPAARVSAGPKDQLADATRPGRGSVANGLGNVEGCCAHSCGAASAALLARRRLDPSALQSLAWTQAKVRPGFGMTPWGFGSQRGIGAGRTQGVESAHLYASGGGARLNEGALGGNLNGCLKRA